MSEEKIGFHTMPNVYFEKIRIYEDKYTNTHTIYADVVLYDYSDDNLSQWSKHDLITKF